MVNENMIRILLGVKRIKENKRLLLMLGAYLVMIMIITCAGRKFLRVLENNFLSELFGWMFLIFMLEITVVGLLFMLKALGTSRNGKRIEKGLKEMGFTDMAGQAPILVSEMKERNGIRYEFYSPRISFYEFEKHQELLEVPINMTIISVDPGKDKRHVYVKAIPSGNEMPQTIKWNNQLLSQEDFILKMGINYSGDELFDLSITPHVLIGGASGSGKTKLLKLLLLQCIRKNADIYLADFKGGVDYPRMWRERCNIIVDAEQLAEQLSVILEIMEKRREQLVESGASNIKAHNQKTGANMRRIIVACDEIAEVLDKTGLEKNEKALVLQIESRFSTIARQGRAFGIHLIFATQRPDADVLKGQIKNNMGMRICGRADKVLSQIILDNTEAADKITQKNQGIFLTNGHSMFKAYLVEDECLEEV